jgi:ABC-type transporter Mla subunit MlaD
MGMRNSYEIKVYFSDVNGLRVGDPVLVYGLTKGKVKKMWIEDNGAAVILSVDRAILLKADSKIAIRSVSYLGPDRYIKVTPGDADSISSVYYGVNETLDLESLAFRLDSLIGSLEDFRPENIGQVVTELSREISRATHNIEKVIKGPSNKIDALVERLDSLSSLLESPGTLGKLLTSPALYEELRETNSAIKELVEDIKANPKRYLEIKVF